MCNFIAIAIGILALPNSCMHKTMNGASFPADILFGLAAMLASWVVVGAVFFGILSFLGVYNIQ
jgi:hypothetical protein